MLGALLKFKLIGFSDIDFKKPTGFFYLAQVNPESYTIDHQVVLAKDPAIGTTGDPPRVAYMRPRKLSFEVIFDATGALASPDGPSPKDLAGRTGVAAQLELFKRTVYTYVGDSHESPFVMIQWGSLVFQAKLETMSTSYKLFSPEGVPLRASVKVAFSEALSNTLLTRLANAMSADLTHVRTVRAGDTLPLLCHEIYGDPTLYVKVAQANSLTNFRSLRPGQELVFPPLVPAEV